MSDEISVRELRNNVSAVIRRVEAGATLRITVNRRPVAALVPLPQRRLAVPWETVRAKLESVQADAALGRDLRRVLTETTDEL